MAEWAISGAWGRAHALPPMRRWSLRGAAEDMAALRLAWGPLPSTMLATTREGGRAALMLGPDEWLLLAEADVAGLARVEGRFSLVDVSDRQIALAIEGPGAAAVLNAGCPLDLDRGLPVGGATRTVLAKAEITLWRTAAARFHVEVWRSYAPYVQALLTQAAADL